MVQMAALLYISTSSTRSFRRLFTYLTTTAKRNGKRSESNTSATSSALEDSCGSDGEDEHLEEGGLNTENATEKSRGERTHEEEDSRQVPVRKVSYNDEGQEEAFSGGGASGNAVHLNLTEVRVNGFRITSHLIWSSSRSIQPQSRLRTVTLVMFPVIPQRFSLLQPRRLSHFSSHIEASTSEMPFVLENYCNCNSVDELMEKEAFDNQKATEESRDKLPHKDEDLPRGLPFHGVSYSDESRDEELVGRRTFDTAGLNTPEELPKNSLADLSSLSVLPSSGSQAPFHSASLLEANLPEEIILGCDAHFSPASTSLLETPTHSEAGPSSRPTYQAGDGEEGNHSACPCPTAPGSISASLDPSDSDTRYEINDDRDDKMGKLQLQKEVIVESFSILIDHYKTLMEESQRMKEARTFAEEAEVKVKEVVADNEKLKKSAEEAKERIREISKSRITFIGGYKAVEGINKELASQMKMLERRNEELENKAEELEEKMDCLSSQNYSQTIQIDTLMKNLCEARGARMALQEDLSLSRSGEGFWDYVQ
ncbi:hypothetical protein D9758_013471 [Tetrapyrgos nigripes]|uniref:Uncharacterized protein n=1 Tax=Tetrapyrgos nigripes TaxID=182062 RepID=A0A8H5CRA6_9AGAR|nr:hypothetical protein D9758_013471 [Tetrapyrgos nigripes]